MQSPADGKAPMNQFGHKTAFPIPPPPARLAQRRRAAFEPVVRRLARAADRAPARCRRPLHPAVGAGHVERCVRLARHAHQWQRRAVLRHRRARLAGTLPPGVDLVRSPTATGWLIGWTQAGGPQDYAAVNQIQSSMSASPLISAAAPSTRARGATPRGGHDPYPQTGAGVGTAPIGSGLPMPAPMQLPPGTPSSRRPRWMRPRSSRCSLTRCAITRRTPTTVPCSTACAASAWTTGAPSTSAA